MDIRPLIGWTVGLLIAMGATGNAETVVEPIALPESLRLPVDADPAAIEEPASAESPANVHDPAVHPDEVLKSLQESVQRLTALGLEQEAAEATRLLQQFEQKHHARLTLERQSAQSTKYQTELERLQRRLAKFDTDAELERRLVAPDYDLCRLAQSRKIYQGDPKTAQVQHEAGPYQIDIIGLLIATGATGNTETVVKPISLPESLLLPADADPAAIEEPASAESPANVQSEKYQTELEWLQRRLAKFDVDAELERRLVASELPATGNSFNYAISPSYERSIREIQNLRKFSVSQEPVQVPKNYYEKTAHLIDDVTETYRLLKSSKRKKDQYPVLR